MTFVWIVAMEPTLEKFSSEITAPSNVANPRAKHDAADNDTIVIQNRTETATTQMNFMRQSNYFEVSHPEQEPVLTLLVMLSGEFGNNMIKIICAWGTAREAQERFGLTTRLVFHQQVGRRGKPRGKAVRATHDLQNCIKLPTYIRTGDFALGKRLVDEGYFQEIPETIFGSGEYKFDLEILNEYLSNHPELMLDEMSNSTIAENGSKVPRLMVRIRSMEIYRVVDTLYDELRATFAFDDEACCGKTLEHPPAEDESVLHLRNFAMEMRESLRKQKGFQQLDKERIATEVLGHLQDGDKIALAGRALEKDAANNSTEAYGIVKSIQAKNLTVRFSPGESGMEDFCFLKNAKKELIGSSKSTFAQMAAYLAGPSLKMARLYQFVTDELANSPELTTLQRQVGQETWTHPELRSRIRFEEYFPKTSNTTR